MTVFPGQIILFLFMGGLAAYLLSKRRQGLDRLLLLGFILSGMVSILFPDLTTRIANLIGIGRGVDLVVYLVIIFNMYFVVYILSENQKQMRIITMITREIAILKARTPGIPGSPSDAAVPRQPGAE